MQVEYVRGRELLSSIFVRTQVEPLVLKEIAVRSWGREEKTLYWGKRLQ